MFTAIYGIKQSKFLPPYTPTGKTTFSDTKRKAGVYIIKENGIVTYIGYSAANLYKTLYRHFQHWNHPWQEVITYKGKQHRYTVRVILSTPAQAERLEKYLIKKIRPRDNYMKHQNADENEGAKEYKKLQSAPVYDPAPF